MIKNPFINAISAFLYIIVVVFTINFLGNFEVNTGIEQFFIPIVFLSLLTLSVAFMGFTFFYTPVRMYLENKREEGIKLFIKTIGIFALLVFLLICAYFVYIGLK